MSSGHSDLKPVMDGIQLVLEEIRDLRRDSLEDRKRADEDRKRADEDRKRADEDRKRADERWERLHRESEERFARDTQEAAEREKGLRQALVVIGNAGRRIIKAQEDHTRLLEQILRAIRAGWNGRSRNGHGR